MISSSKPNLSISLLPGGKKNKKEILLILDVLNPLLSAPHPLHLPTFLSGLVSGPAVSLVATYHLDVPLSSSSAPSNAPGGRCWNEYEPHPLATLTHLATAVLRATSLRREVDRRRAAARSLAEPGWGVGEGREGVLLGFRRVSEGGDEKPGGAEKTGDGGLILEMELRRRSGRAVSERFVLVPSSPSSSPSPTRIFPLESHPLFLTPSEDDDAPDESHQGGGEDGEQQTPTSTFNLGLTAKQRRDREGVVLPYFDAQTDVGSAGEGGRILYEMGREDDFDDEEDEI